MEDKRYWNIFHVYEIINEETERLETVQQCVFTLHATEEEVKKFVADQNNIKIIPTEIGDLHYHGVSAVETNIFGLEDVTFSLLEYAFNIKVEELESDEEFEDSEFKIEEIEELEDSEEVEDEENIRFSEEEITEEKSCESCKLD